MPKNAGVMSMIGSYYRGAYIKGFLGTTDGIYSAAAHPIKTVEGLTDIMLNPGILGKAIKDYTNEKIIHGSIEDRAEFVGQAITEIGLAVVTSGITGVSEGTKTASTASKIAEIADEAGNISRGEKVSSKIVEIGEEFGDTSKIKPPSKIVEPNKPPIEVPKAEKAPIEIPEITEKPKLPELEKPIDKVDDIAKEKPLYKEYIKPVSKAVNPKEIRYSQTSVNDSEVLIERMKKYGWRGDPIDIVEMPDGLYTTLDNTRVVAAREVGIEVQANIHGYNDIIPESSIVERLTTPKGVPVTWGDAVNLRIGKQKASFRNNYPFGSFDMETIK